MTPKMAIRNTMATSIPLVERARVANEASSGRKTFQGSTAAWSGASSGRRVRESARAAAAHGSWSDRATSWIRSGGSARSVCSAPIGITASPPSSSASPVW